MGEVERRRGYGYNRVLIESARILDPEFADAVVFLSGAQIEMLRNVTQYLNRLDTYTSEYGTGYYLVPTDEDFDEIIEIVADLEETLMGNPNVIWGYTGKWRVVDIGTSTGASYTDAESDPVPEGYVHVVEHWTIVHASDSPLPVVFRVQGSPGTELLYEAPALPQDDYVWQPEHVSLAEGDILRLRVWGLSIGETCTLTAWGHTMKVPA